MIASSSAHALLVAPGVALAVALAVAPLSGAAAGRAQNTGQAALRYEIVKRSAAPDAAGIGKPPPAFEQFSIEAVRRMVPEQHTGRSARMESIDRLYFLHSSNMIEMDRMWAARGRDTPQSIVLGRGSYTLEAVWRQIGDESVIARAGEGRYVLKRPLYIAPTATFIVSGGQELRLSVTDGTFIISNGTLVVVDSELVAWDTTSDQPSRREALAPDTALLYARQIPRPYLLASEGSNTFIAGSTVRGLGYKGTSGTFGISFTPSASGARLADHLRRLPNPTGWIVGSRIRELFFGFYSNQAEDVVILGNLFTDNVIYGIDPHDYSARLLIARNVAQGSSIAHGIIFSRGVRDSWIVENLANANGGSGIMMDRSSSENVIAANLVLGNQGDGIAIFESDRNLLRGNTVARSGRNGILVRNSSEVTLTDNALSTNGRSGIELSVLDISALETRDFVLDPFRKHASAYVHDNLFDDNLQSAVSMQAADALTLHANTYVASGPLYFDGDLRPHAGKLLAAELAREIPTTVRRVGAAHVEPERKVHGAGQADRARAPNPVLREHARGGAPRAMVGMGRYLLREQEDAKSWRRGVYWYARAIRHARVSAMSELGIALLGGVARNATERREGLVLLSMAASLGDQKAKEDLLLLPDLLGTEPAEITAAGQEASRRLRSRRLWNAEAFPDLSIRFSGDEAVQARRRVARLGQARKKSKPSRPPRLDPTRRKRYKERVGAKNAKRLRLNQRLADTRLRDARARGDRRAYLDRVDGRERAARLRIEDFTAQQWKDVLERVAHNLDLVNTHRDPSDPILPEEILLPKRRD